MSDAQRWPALMSREDVAEYLSLSLSTVSRLIADGSLETKVFSRLVRIPKSSVDAFIESLPKSTHASRASRRPAAKRAQTT